MSSLKSHLFVSRFDKWFIHDDVIKWKHFPRNWPFVREIHRSPVNFPHKGQWRGALMFSLIYAWINDWVNNREAGDLRRQHGHYDVIVMWRYMSCAGGKLTNTDQSPVVVLYGGKTHASSKQFNGLVQGCNMSRALAKEILQSCTKFPN